MEYMLEHEARVAISDAYKVCSMEEDGKTPQSIKFERELRERLARLRRAVDGVRNEHQSEYLARLDVAERVLNNRVECIEMMKWKNQLLMAIYQGDMDEVKRLVEGTARTGVNGVHGVHGGTKGTDGMIEWAAACGNLEAVRYLHEVCHEPCTDEALDNAIEAGASNVIEYLKEHRFE